MPCLANSNPKCFLSTPPPLICSRRRHFFCQHRPDPPLTSAQRKPFRLPANPPPPPDSRDGGVKPPGLIPSQITGFFHHATPAEAPTLSSHGRRPSLSSLCHGHSVPNDRGFIVPSLENGTKPEFGMASQAVEQARSVGESLRKLEEMGVLVDSVKIRYSLFSRMMETARVVAGMLGVPFEGPGWKKERKSIALPVYNRGGDGRSSVLGRGKGQEERRLGHDWLLGGGDLQVPASWHLTLQSWISAPCRTEATFSVFVASLALNIVTPLKAEARRRDTEHNSRPVTTFFGLISILEIYLLSTDGNLSDWAGKIMETATHD
ncbi:hypothetical protein ZWY2020_046805 [Hordeum vulgare]|nr:hypothetical protein ZWY2020_046805 [Hordeum vulgare]